MYHDVYHALCNDRLSLNHISDFVCDHLRWCSFQCQLYITTHIILIRDKYRDSIRKSVQENKKFGKCCSFGVPSYFPTKPFGDAEALTYFVIFSNVFCLVYDLNSCALIMQICVRFKFFNRCNWLCSSI